MERADAGVADEHVDLAERLDGRCDKLGAGLRIGHIGLGRHGPAPKARISSTTSSPGPAR